MDVNRDHQVKHGLEDRGGPVDETLLVNQLYVLVDDDDFNGSVNNRIVIKGKLHLRHFT